MKIHTTAHLLIVAAEFPIYPCRFFGQFTALGSSYHKQAFVVSKGCVFGASDVRRAEFLKQRSWCGSGQANALHVFSAHFNKGILLRARFVEASNVVAIFLAGTELSAGRLDG
jgi:hypothetical protein